MNSKHPHLSKSPDKGYHFGHVRGNMSVGTELKHLDEFSKVIDQLFRTTADCVEALAYPWTEIYGEDEPPTAAVNIIQPKATFGPTELPPIIIQGGRESSGCAGSKLCTPRSGIGSNTVTPRKHPDDPRDFQSAGELTATMVCEP